MSLEARSDKQHSEDVKDTTPNDAARSEGGISEKGVGHSGTLPEGQGKELPVTEYTEPLSKVAHRLQPVESPEDLDRTPALLPEKRWFQKRPFQVVAGVVATSLVATVAYVAGRGSDEKEAPTGSRATATAPANPGVPVVPGSDFSSQPAPEITTGPVTPEDVKKSAEDIRLDPELFDPELMEGLVTNGTEPEIEDLKANYASYTGLYGSQAGVFQDNISPEAIQNIQRDYYELMEKGMIYDRAALDSGLVQKMTTVEYLGVLAESGSGITEFPIAYPTPAEIQNFTPTAETGDIKTYLATSARENSLNDPLTAWVARNEQALKSYNDKQTDDTKIIPAPSFNLESMTRAGFAAPDSAVGQEGIMKRMDAFMANPDTAVSEYNDENGHIVNILKVEGKLGTNKINLYGFTAVYERIVNGQEVPVMGTFALVPLEKQVVNGKLIEKPIIVPALLIQNLLDPAATS